MRSNTKKTSIVAALALAAAFLLPACSAVNLGGAQTEPTMAPPVVQSSALTTEGRLVPLRSSALGFQTGGELSELAVSEGQAVEKGEVLARLGPREAVQAAISQAELEALSARQALDELNDTATLLREQAAQAVADARHALTEAKNAFNLLDTNEFQDELDDLNIALSDAQDELDDAKDELDKYQSLGEDNATRKDAQTAYDDALDTYDEALYARDSQQQQLDQARAAVDLASAQLEDALRRLDARQNGPDRDALALAQARVDAADAQVAAARRAHENMDLTAPYAGTVVDLYDLEPGETLPFGKPVVTLADFSSWMVETRDLNELDIVDVQVGQKAIVTPDALPDLALEGVVESIDQVFTERSGDILYTVRIRLDQSDPRLRWGMTVTVTFEQ